MLKITLNEDVAYCDKVQITGKDILMVSYNDKEKFYCKWYFNKKDTLIIEEYK